MCRFRLGGYTLLEMMMSLMLTMMVIALVLQDYSHHHRELLWWRDHHELDRKAQRLIAILREQIHVAGYLGCAKLSDDFPLLGYQNETLTLENKFKVNRQNHLIIRGMSDAGVLLQASASGQTSIKILSPGDFKNRNRMIITDCAHGELFDIKNSYHEKDGWRIELVKPLRSSYAEGAFVGVLAVNEFYIDRGSHADSSAHQVSSLFYKNRVGAVRELIQGVNQWSFKFSETYQDRHRNVSPSEVQDWRHVEGVSIIFELSNNKLTRHWNMYAALP